MRFALILLLHFLFSISYTPDLLSKTVVGKYAGEFLSLGTGARYLALGGSAVSYAKDIHAGYWNPAGLADMQYPQIALMHANTFAGLVNYDYASLAFPFGKKNTVALSVLRLGISDIADTRQAWDPLNMDTKENPTQHIRFFNATDYAFLFSYAGSSYNQLTYGINIKFIHRSLGDIGSAYGIGLDVGFMYPISEKINLGLTIQDITTTYIAWNSGQNELITPTVKAGICYQLEIFEGQLLIAHDIDTRFEGRKEASQFHVGEISFDFHTGIEYEYRERLAFRTGIDDLGKLTLGTGLRLSEMYLDYCFTSSAFREETGQAHRISLRLNLSIEEFKR